MSATPMSATPMSEILAVHGVRNSISSWLILDCGHWYKWTPNRDPLPGSPINPRRPRVGSTFPCPNCATITVVRP